MELTLKPGIGASDLLFGMQRDFVRSRLSDLSYSQNIATPSNDRYIEEGILLGYDRNEKLEFIEIFSPSVAVFEGIYYLSMDFFDCIDEMNQLGYEETFDSDGCEFKAVGIGLYCPGDDIESVCIYREGYYD